MDSQFIISAASAHQFPSPKAREIAVVGRSNSGKSTLLNKILSRRDLVRVSRTPGRTQLVNFFSLNRDCLLVDLPGYGYSATGQSQREMWADLIRNYLEHRKISTLFFLIDSRRNFDDQDTELLLYLAKMHPVLIVATKMDKLSQNESRSRLADLRAQLQQAGFDGLEVIGVSSLKNHNIDMLRRKIFAKELH